MARYRTYHSLVVGNDSDKKSTKSKSKPMKGVAFSDMVIHLFKDKSFREGISPVLADILAPTIENTVYTAVSTAVNAAVDGIKTTLINDMLNSNKALQETVTKQTKIIENQKKNIEDRKIMLDSNQSTIDDLQNTVHILTIEMDQLRP